MGGAAAAQATTFATAGSEKICDKPSGDRLLGSDLVKRLIASTVDWRGTDPGSGVSERQPGGVVVVTSDAMKIDAADLPPRQSFHLEPYRSEQVAKLVEVLALAAA